MTINAKVIAYSQAQGGGTKIMTLALVYPRLVHSELMTHRAFSRSASSSRAITIDRMIEAVKADIAMPVAWGANQPGMQARAMLPEDRGREAKKIWLEAAEDALYYARRMQATGAHKQIVNRLLEPFAHISTVVTATDWANFYLLRDHPDADPTMEALAQAMRGASQEVRPTVLGAGEFHAPFYECGVGRTEQDARVSAARCARVSYNNHDGTRPSLERDLDLAARLLQSRHMSPFEHQAWPTPGERHANFQDWRSQRREIEALEK